MMSERGRQQVNCHFHKSAAIVAAQPPKESLVEKFQKKDVDHSRMYKEKKSHKASKTASNTAPNCESDKNN